MTTIFLLKPVVYHFCNKVITLISTSLNDPSNSLQDKFLSGSRGKYITNRKQICEQTKVNERAKSVMDWCGILQIFSLVH